MKAVAREQQCYHNEADVQGNNSSTIEYNKITVQQLRQEIKSVGIDVPRIVKMRKIQLVET